jgi:IS30 family transposase
MSYKHLTIEECCCLREYYNKGYSYRKIAKLLGRNVSTISREINRNKTYMNVKPAYFYNSNEIISVIFSPQK